MTPTVDHPKGEDNTGISHKWTSPLPLLCKVQTYDWGQVASKSRVFKYHQNQQKHLVEGNPSALTKIDQNEENLDSPYAELWIGTHPNGPSQVLVPVTSTESTSLIPLQRILPESKPLSFLIKVLSVRKSLSIQAHPDDQLAIKLHARDPVHYPDDQAKPEMAIALSPFEALCGFRPIPEIYAFCVLLPSWADTIGKDLVDSLKQSLTRLENAKTSSLNSLSNQDPLIEDVLRLILKKLLTMSPSQIDHHLRLIEKDLHNTNEFPERKEIASQINLNNIRRLFAKVSSEFPSDGGIFFIFLLNHFILQPGEAIYLAANEPHAYLSGDCIEIMSNSDNVVRAGLTPKFKDSTTLLNMLTFRTGGLDSFKVPSRSLKDKGYPYGMLYKPSYVVLNGNNVNDKFAVIESVFPSSKGSNSLVSDPLFPIFKPMGENGQLPFVLICTQGEGYILAGNPDFPSSLKLPLYPGCVYFIPSEMDKISVSPSFSYDFSNLVIFQAFDPRD